MPVASLHTASIWRKAIRCALYACTSAPSFNPPPSASPVQGSFLVTIWKGLSPEESIQHQNFSFSAPEYKEDGLDRFVEYPLDSTIYVEGTIYIGWTQTNDVVMNLGFDRNRDNASRIFYRTTGAFTNTSFSGSLMMRPVFVAAVDPTQVLKSPCRSRKCCCIRTRLTSSS